MSLLFQRCRSAFRCTRSPCTVPSNNGCHCSMRMRNARRIFHSAMKWPLKLYEVFISWHCKHSHIMNFDFYHWAIAFAAYNGAFCLCFCDFVSWCSIHCNDSRPTIYEDDRKKRGKKIEKRWWRRRKKTQCRSPFFVRCQLELQFQLIFL